MKMGKERERQLRGGFIGEGDVLEGLGFGEGGMIDGSG
jgi:hypothetical protein